MRRFSIEAFSRASSDDLRNTIMSLNDPHPNQHVLKAESRGHHRNFSVTSQLSSSSQTSSVTSSSSVASKRSSSISISEAQVAVWQPDEMVPDSMPAITQSPPTSGPMKALKAMFRRSKQFGTTQIEVKKLGSLNRTGLEAAVSTHKGPREEVISFKMTSLSYVTYNGLSDTLDLLSENLPNVQDIVLYAQVYTLEELDTLTPYISRFAALRSLSILDAQDDPPMVCPTLCKIITLWAIECPSLRRIQFRTGSWWEANHAEIDEKEWTAEWVERISQTS